MHTPKPSPHRALRAGDFFPDLVGRTADGLPWHAATALGEALAVWVFDGVQAYEQHGAAAAACRASRLAGVARHDVLLDQADAVARLVLPDAEVGVRLYLLLRDGKIAWTGSLDDAATCPALACVRQRMADDGTWPTRPPALTVRDVLDTTLCARLVDRFEQSAHKIQGRVGLSSPVLDPSRKRVSHVNLDADAAAEVDEAIVYSLLPMVERCFDLRVTRRVAYKVALYDGADGGFFHAHRDNTDAGTRYRRLALSLALNDDWDGGGLAFPEFGPERHRIGAGNAMVFPASLLHQVQPVARGRRYVLLSFLYDEAGAVTRRAAMADPAILDALHPDAIDASLLADYATRYAPASRFCP